MHIARRLFRPLVILIVAGIFLSPGVAKAFNRHFILSDALLELTPESTMTVDRIQRFLEVRGSTLASYSEVWFGERKSAAEIIYDAADAYDISPKYILVTLQKEQSLVEDSDPTQRQLDFAMGYGCPDSTGCTNTYKGFAKQIYAAAENIRGDKYLGGLEKRGYTISGWGPGITKYVDGGIDVTPVNNATAVLYTYTPHIHGNELFSNLWKRFFSLAYPNGSILQDMNSGGIYIIDGGVKRPFLTRSAFFSRHSAREIIQVPPSVLDAYETGRPIKFADYTFIRSPQGTVCMIKGDLKYCISSGETLRQIGINPEEIENVGWDDFHSYQDGSIISTADIFPNGALLQRTDTGGVYYVENGVKHPIYSREILSSQYPGRTIIQKSALELDEFALGEPLKFKDGTIITSPGTSSVYIISDGTRRRIASSRVFNELGFRWDNIIVTTDKALFLHTEGAPIDVE